MRLKRTSLLFIAAAVAAPLFSIAVPVNADVKAAGEFKPEDYGAVANDGKGDTEAINRTIDAAGEAGGGTIVFGAGTYDIDVIDFHGTAVAVNVTKPNISFELTNSTVFKVVPTSAGEFCAIDVKGDNFRISGGSIVGDRSNHKGSDGADGHGIGVRDCKNVQISNLTVSDNWGDGIYLGSVQSDGSYPGCSYVTVTNCVVKNNRRNNIAIVDADHVVIDGCNISGANGASPQCGILIEPNTNQGNVPKKAVCSAIEIKNTTVKSKKAHQKNGQFFALNILNPYYQSNNKVVAKNVKITKCTFKGDVGNYSGKSVTFNKCKIKGTFYDHKNTKLKKCTIKNNYKF
ncbi:right-handed parallel beta-helix repeat-containing protein [Butyrivibrio sp. WCE2006]|uniref:right-handed parallel beta-helix repeat-containing protein n=1 Tax=Butyrivibrio sp. WCE2006 TaxID=1410611 RepID=UPI0005D2D1DD|nr:right-handed parallel beta-helix repeat-containing protein [Butyrivibrio sp. WCE2006]